MLFRTGTYMRPALKIQNARIVIYSTSRPENFEALCSKAVRFKVESCISQYLKDISTLKNNIHLAKEC